MSSQVLVIYDSAYGNTEKVARAIAGAFPERFSPQAILVRKVTPEEVAAARLLIVGSPTHGGRPTAAMQQWLAELPPRSLGHVRVAAFDTRFASEYHGLGVRFIMKVVGYAAGRIRGSLERKGGTPAAAPEGFIVQDKEGPLRPGELDRAASWGTALSSDL